MQRGQGRGRPATTTTTAAPTATIPTAAIPTAASSATGATGATGATRATGLGCSRQRHGLGDGMMTAVVASAGQPSTREVYASRNLRCMMPSLLYRALVASSRDREVASPPP